MSRARDWPERLAEVVRAASNKPYKLGQHDCFRFACECAHALTGADYDASFGGRYKTERGALRLIRRFAGGESKAAVTKLLGREPAPVTLAQRGDWLLYRDAKGEHLAVCMGSKAAALGDDGLALIPVAMCLYTWRID